LSYSDNLDNEGIKSQFLAVFKPRRIASTTWTLISGTKYSQSFDFGTAVILDVDGTEKTLATSSALSDGDWYYDKDSELIYIDIGSDPASDTVVITYEIYFGTFDAHFPRIPTAAPSATNFYVYYEPMITNPPQIQSTSSDSLFGFLPTQSTQISMSNATHLFEKHVYDSSFNLADIDIYHYLGELTTDNVKLIFQAVTKKPSYNDRTVVFNLLDRTDVFNTAYRNPTGISFYNTTRFPNLDPVFDRRPIRKVYGVVQGFIPVNIDFNKTATTSNNRTWICIADNSNLGSVSATVPASPASTSTRTYVDDTTGLRVDDSVWIDSSAGAGSDEYPIITGVGANYIDHATITNPAASASVVKRSFVGNLTLFKDNVAYSLLYGRDYDEYTDGTNKVAGFTLTNNFEANHSIAVPLEPFDVLYGRIYGQKNTTTLGGGAFGSDSSTTGNLTQAVVIFFDLLKNLGLPESVIDTATFTALQGTNTDEIGLAIPEFSINDFPNYKTIINRINQSILGKIFVDDDNKWTLRLTGPAAAVDKTIEDDEILRNTFRYELDYQDIISDIIVQYAGREINEKHAAGSDSFSRVTSSSETAEYLHKIQKQRTFTSVHFIESEAQTLADHLKFALGDRQGNIRFQTKNRFFGSELGDNIKVSRPRLPGFDYDKDTARERETVVISTDKSLNQINIETTDQKGIEDNSGSW